MWDTTSHIRIVVPNTMHSHCKAHQYNIEPHISCTNNAVILVVCPPPKEKCLTIVNFINNGGMVISMSASRLCTNFLANFEHNLDEICFQNDENATVAREQSNNDTITKDDEGIFMITDAN
eukprot:7513331-Ditylum_brightwellii.AAC.1